MKENLGNTVLPEILSRNVLMITAYCGMVVKRMGLKIDLFEDNLRTEDEASLQYWIRTMNAVQKFMKLHRCSAEKAVADMCLAETEQDILLNMIRNDQKPDG